MLPETVQKLMQMIEFIKSYQVQFGTSPSYREIAEHLGLKSTSGITYFMKQGEKRGLLRKQYGTRRTIEVL